MASANFWVGIGNLCRDPELRYTANDRAVGKIIVAVNRKFTHHGQEREETSYIECELWGKVAESVGKMLGKGSPVYIEGRLKTDRWEKNGETHSKLIVVAHRCQFLGKPRNRGRTDEGEAHPGEQRHSAHEEPDFGVDPNDNLQGLEDQGVKDECPF